MKQLVVNWVLTDIQHYFIRRFTAFIDVKSWDMSWSRDGIFVGEVSKLMWICLVQLRYESC